MTIQGRQLMKTLSFYCILLYSILFYSTMDRNILRTTVWVCEHLSVCDSIRLCLLAIMKFCTHALMLKNTLHVLPYAAFMCVHVYGCGYLHACVFLCVCVCICVHVCFRLSMHLVSEHSILQSPGQLFVCFSHAVASLAR